MPYHHAYYCTYLFKTEKNWYVKIRECFISFIWQILQQVNSTGDEIDDTITRSELKQALDFAIVSTVHNTER